MAKYGTPPPFFHLKSKVTPSIKEKVGCSGINWTKKKCELLGKIRTLSKRKSYTSTCEKGKDFETR